METPATKRYEQIIRHYYSGCSKPDFEIMMSTFHPDVVHYFVDHSPVFGAVALANYWMKAQPRTDAHWEVDHIIAQDNEAVIEWSMHWTPPKTGLRETLRGSEWYIFDGDLIKEIRSYHNNFFMPNPKNRELWAFPYAERSFTEQALKPNDA